MDLSVGVMSAMIALDQSMFLPSPRVTSSG